MTDTPAERPARVAIPEALAADVAARPEAYRPGITDDAEVLILAAPEAPDFVGRVARVWAWGDNFVSVTTDTFSVSLVTAWALVGTTSEGLRPRLRVLILDAEAPEWRGRVVAVTGGARAAAEDERAKEKR